MESKCGGGWCHWWYYFKNNKERQTGFHSNASPVPKRTLVWAQEDAGHVRSLQLAWPLLTLWLACTQNHQWVLTWLEQQCVLVNLRPRAGKRFNVLGVVGMLSIWVKDLKDTEEAFNGGRERKISICLTLKRTQDSIWWHKNVTLIFRYFCILNQRTDTCGGFKIRCTITNQCLKPDPN